MRILIIDPFGYAVDWSIRCSAAAHEVRHFIKELPQCAEVGEGLVTIVRDFHPWLQWAELIFCADNTLYSRELSAFKRDNPEACIIGGNEAAAKMELDRAEGMSVLKAHDILIPASQEFTSYDKAIEYVKKKDERFVSKPNGDADKSLSYVSKSPEDLVYMLQRWKRSNKLKGSFILQEFIPGIEMAVGGWFGPGGWNDGWCENFEFKKLMNDDLGVATGEQGTVIEIVNKSKLASQMLIPLTDYLQGIGYVGYVDVNCIIDAAGTAWPLEFTMRPGWPTFNIQQALHRGDHAEWLKDLCEGRDASNWEKNQIGLGVVLSIPDYPYSHVTRKEVTGIPVYGIKSPLSPDIHLCEMKLGTAPVKIRGSITEVPHLVTAGDYLLVVTAVGETVREAQRKAYRSIKKLSVPNSPMYRTDIGDRLEKQIPILRSMGYARMIQY